MSANWDDLKVALAIHRAGSLTRAADILGIDQSTCGRRLAALEAALGALLFLRSKTGLLATEQGEAAIARAIEIEARMTKLADELSAGAEGPSGLVRLVGSPWTLGLLAAEAVGDLLAAHPRLDLRLVAGSPRALPRPEPTVSLWFEAPPRESEFAVKLGDVPYGIYAASDADASALPWLSFHDEDTPRLAPTRALERLRKRGERIRLTTSDTGALMGAVAAGHGKALLPMCLAARQPNLTCLDEGEPPLVRALHLHLHPDSVQAQRVQAVIRWLRERTEQVFGSIPSH